jgi:hypothetical protein
MRALRMTSVSPQTVPFGRAMLRMDGRPHLHVISITV